MDQTVDPSNLIDCDEAEMLIADALGSDPDVDVDDLVLYEPLCPTAQDKLVRHCLRCQRCFDTWASLGLEYRYRREGHGFDRWTWFINELLAACRELEALSKVDHQKAVLDGTMRSRFRA